MMGQFFADGDEENEDRRNEVRERAECSNSKISFEVEQHFIIAVSLYRQNFVEYGGMSQSHICDNLGFSIFYLIFQILPKSDISYQWIYIQQNLSRKGTAKSIILHMTHAHRFDFCWDHTPKFQALLATTTGCTLRIQQWSSTENQIAVRQEEQNMMSNRDHISPMVIIAMPRNIGISGYWNVGMLSSLQGKQ